MQAEGSRENAAEQDTDRSAARGDETEDAHRLRPLHRLGEEGDDQRKRGRRSDGAGETLHRAKADQLRLRGGEPGAE